MADTAEPHRLCVYLFELASAFTTFYEKCPVLQADSGAVRDSRLALSALTLRVLTHRPRPARGPGPGPDVAGELPGSSQQIPGSAARLPGRAGRLMRMDNVNQPPGQPPDDPSSTQPFRFTPGWPGGARVRARRTGIRQQPGRRGRSRGPGRSGRAAASSRAAPAAAAAGKSGRLLRWAAGIAAAALLARAAHFGGLSWRPAPLSAASGELPASAVALNGALGSAAARPAAARRKRHPGGPARGGQHLGGQHPAGSRAAPGGAAACVCSTWSRGMYGQVTFHGQQRDGDARVRAGQGQSSSGGHLVVQAANGTTWTWNLASNSVVRERGKHRVRPARWPRGQRVFVAGQVVGSSKDARLVVIRPANGRQLVGNSSPSPPALPLRQ